MYRIVSCYLVLAASILIGVAPAVAQEVHKDLWVPDDRAFASAVVNDHLYLGGSFTYVGPPTGPSAVIDMETLEADLSIARIQGRVHVVEPDGDGGWFVGGSFDYAGGERRWNLVHILSDGSLNQAFAPDPWLREGYVGHRGSVDALQLVDGVLYVGGNFSELAGRPHRALAALDARTGDPLSIDLQIEGSFGGGGPDVRTLRVIDGILYFGGVFLTVNGEERTGIGAVRIDDGSLLPWAPKLEPGVPHFIQEGDRTLYLGGRFERVNGEERVHLAEVTLADDSGQGGDLTPFRTAKEESFYAGLFLSMAVGPEGIYAGGIIRHFAQGYRFESAMVRIDRITGRINYRVGPPFRAATGILLTDDVIHVGMIRKRADFPDHRELIGIDRDTGLELVYRVAAGGNGSPSFGRVKTMAEQNGRLFTGGTFNSITGRDQIGFVAIDLSTGRPTDTAGFSANVLAPSPDERSVFMATSSGLREFDVQTEEFTSWRPQGEPRGITAIGVSDSLVYVAGVFGLVDGQPRGRVAAFHRETGRLAEWTNEVYHYTLYPIERVVVAEPYVYLAGGITQVGEERRGGFAALDMVTGELADWDPKINLFTRARGRALAISGDRVYLGGMDLTHIDGVERRLNLLAVDRLTGELLDWAPRVSGTVGESEYPVNVITIAEGVVYVGGDFSRVDLQRNVRSFAAAFDAETGDLLDWDLRIVNTLDPALNSVRTISYSPTHDRVYLGGGFGNTLGGSGHGFLVGASAARSVAGERIATDIEDGPPSAPSALRLLPPYPNPFRTETTLSLELPESQHVEVAVYDLLGRRVAVLHSGTLRQGRSDILLNQRNLGATGVYIVRASGDRFVLSRQVMLVR
jgi:outer membrane protein assembly factor BamB